MWIWLGASFVVSLLAAIAFGVRGAIVSFVLGALSAIAPLLLDAMPARSLGFDWIDAAVFRTVYWWMMAFPAAAVGLVVRSWRSRRRAAKDVF